MTTDQIPMQGISVYTGALFDYDDPVIDIVDVAHGLGNACRFGNQAARFYSVAEHSCLVAAIVGMEDPRLVLPALWHDAHEAYAGDIPTPLKIRLGAAYRDVIESINRAIADYLGLDVALFHASEIVDADRRALEYEAATLQPNSEAWAYTKNLDHFAATRAYGPLQCLLPEAAERAFLNMNEVLGIYANH